MSDPTLKHINRSIKLPRELAAAAKAYCDRHGVSLSTLIRKALAEAIGKPRLAEMDRPGRPTKGESK